MTLSEPPPDWFLFSVVGRLDSNTFAVLMQTETTLRRILILLRYIGLPRFSFLLFYFFVKKSKYCDKESTWPENVMMEWSCVFAKLTFLPFCGKFYKSGRNWKVEDIVENKKDYEN